MNIGQELDELRYENTCLKKALRNEIFKNVIAKFKSVYGSDIDLSANTPDGQFVAVLVEDLMSMTEERIRTETKKT